MRPAHKLSPYVGHLTSFSSWPRSYPSDRVLSCKCVHLAEKDQERLGRGNREASWGIMEKGTYVYVWRSGSLSVWGRCIQNHHPSGRSDAKVRGQPPPQTHHHTNKDMQWGPWGRGQCVSKVGSRERVRGISGWLKIKEGGDTQCSNMFGKFYTQQIWWCKQTQSLTSLTLVHLPGSWDLWRFFSPRESVVCSELLYCNWLGNPFERNFWLMKVSWRNT